MKNVFFALAFMLIGTFAFASTGEVTKLNENVTTSVIELKTAKSLEKAEDEWACCTVTRNGGSATVCRSDGNASKACRQARRYTKIQ